MKNKPNSKFLCGTKQLPTASYECVIKFVINLMNLSGKVNRIEIFCWIRVVWRELQQWTETKLFNEKNTKCDMRLLERASVGVEIRPLWGSFSGNSAGVEKKQPHAVANRTPWALGYSLPGPNTGLACEVWSTVCMRSTSMKQSAEIDDRPIVWWWSSAVAAKLCAW